jgi:N6-adenosine-specific RNA methylase IME4
VTRFSVIVADCPWSFSDQLTMSKVKRGAGSNYKLLGIDDIIALPVKELASDDAILALWVPSALLAEGLRTMAAWGFVQKTVFTWVKTAKGGSGLAIKMGHTFRGATEHALIGKRGRPKRLNGSQRNVALDLATKHSVKPETLQDRLDLMYAGEKLELFARRERPGWRCLGNEIDGKDIRDSLSELR